LEVVRVREREGREILARLPRGSLLPCVHRLEDKEKRGKMEMLAEGKGWPARVFLLVGFAREKERRKKKRGRIDGLADFCLNFERFKFWSKCWW
jgi:hypothetical protein